MRDFGELGSRFDVFKDFASPRDLSPGNLYEHGPRLHMIIASSAGTCFNEDVSIRALTIAAPLPTGMSNARISSYSTHTLLPFDFV